MRPEPTSELLDAIVRQDKLKLCEIHERVLEHPDVDLWIFHRWDKPAGEFKLVFPALKTLNPFPSDLVAMLENKKSLVDNNVSRSYGEWAETKDYCVTLILPLVHNSQLVGLVQGFSSRDLETCRRIPRMLGPRVR